MMAVFVDGPLQGEAVSVPPARAHAPVFDVPLPPRTTLCVCNDPEIAMHRPAEVFRYHLVAGGPKVLVYAESDDGDALIHALKNWVVSDFTKDWRFRCRDKRAFR